MSRADLMREESEALVLWLLLAAGRVVALFFGATYRDPAAEGASFFVLGME